MKFDSIRQEVRGATPLRSYPKFRSKYNYEYEKDGRKVLVKNGQTNFYDMIQEGKDDNSPKSILKRMEKGDMTALGDLQAGFIDALAYPKNFMEAQNVRLKMENMFNSLSAEQKATYGQDVNRFVKDMNEKLDVKLKEAAEKHRQDLIKQQGEVPPAPASPTPDTEVSNNG